MIQGCHFDMKDQLEQINDTLQKLAPEQMQSIAALTTLGAAMAGYIAYTGHCKAKALRELQIAKKQAYKAVLAELKERGKEPAPSLVKDYVGTLCSEHEYVYALAERTNAACTHTLDLIRSCLSALKAEMQTVNYYNQ